MRKLLTSGVFLLALLFLGAPHVHAAIAFDNSSGVNSGTGTSITWNFTNNGDAVTVCGVADASKTLTAKYNGVAMTQTITHAWNPNTTQNDYCFILTAAPTGTHAVLITASGSANIWGVSSSYSGVKASFTPATGFYSGNDAAGNFTATVNVVDVGSWLVETAWPADASPNSVVNGVTRQAGPGNPNIADSNGPVGTGNQTIGYGWSASDRHIIIAFSLTPAVPPVTNVGFGDIFLFQ